MSVFFSPLRSLQQHWRDSQQKAAYYSWGSARSPSSLRIQFWHSNFILKHTLGGTLITSSAVFTHYACRSLSSTSEFWDFRARGTETLRWWWELHADWLQGHFIGVSLLVRISAPNSFSARPWLSRPASESFSYVPLRILNCLWKGERSWFFKFIWIFELSHQHLLFIM